MRKVWIALFNFDGRLATEIWIKPYGTHYPGQIAMLGPVEIDASIIPVDLLDEADKNLETVKG